MSPRFRFSLRHRYGRLKTSARRRRRPHVRRAPGRRMQAFGVNKRRHLLAVPLLVLAIFLAAIIRNPAMQVNSFHPLSAKTANPLMGWAIDAQTSPAQASVDHSLVYATLTWRDFEPRQDEYDFESFEKKNNLDDWWALGKKLVIRFVMDAPGDQPHMDIPDYLYSAMGDESGTPYVNSLGQGFSPNYRHPYLEERHRLSIKALGQRYDNHPGVAFVEMGSLGHNGSWRTMDVESEWALPPASQLMTWAWHYQEAFPHTPLLMSAPYQPARVMELGLYSDFLGQEDLWDWLQVIQQGGYDSNIGCELRPMPAALETGLVGSRFGSLSRQDVLLDEDLSLLLRQLSACRAAYVAGLDISIAQKYPSGLEAAQSAMGYHLWVQEARFPDATRAGYRLRLGIDMVNDGPQPFPAPWPVELSLLQNGQAVYTQVTPLDITALTAGQHALFLELDLDRNLSPGDYQLAIALLDPHTGAPAVALEMDTPVYGLRHVLGDVKVLPG